MKRHQVSSDGRGFTLIELLLYVSIVGTLLIAVTGFLALSTEARVKNQSISEVNQQGIAVMNMMMQAIRNSTGVTLPATGATGSVLTVTMPTAGISPTVFDLNGSTLQIKEGTGSTIPLTNNKVQVAAFTVKNLTRTGGYANIQISLTLARVNTSNRNEYDFQKTFVNSAEVQW